MRLSGRSLSILFVAGFVCGLVGDHAHVASGTTRYLDVGGAPVLWGSPLFFPITVGLATAALAELRMHLGGGRPGDAGEGLAGVASVLAIYLLTALLSDERTSIVTALVVCLAVLVCVRFATGPQALVCGAIAAVVGPAAEIAQHHAGVFEYAAGSDGMLAVAPWLVPLYFTFGVVAARLGEILGLKDI